VVEFLDRILAGIDTEVARQFQRLLEKQGIGFKLASKVAAIDSSGAVLKATIEPAAGGAAVAERGTRCGRITRTSWPGCCRGFRSRSTSRRLPAW
jgi:NADPH-dependent 2,4-dienoyl-CoA reductase/sulfur reductase-like enzyme